MHPVLFEIPFPSWSVPLGPALGLLTVSFAVIAMLGYTGRARDLLAIGIVGAAGSALGAWRVWGQAIVLGPVPIYGYGGLLCAALAVGLLVTLALSRRQGWPQDEIVSACAVALVFGLVGARALYVIENHSDFASLARLFAVRHGGLAAYGGFFGGAIATLVFLDRRRIPWLGFADAAAPGLGLGVVFGQLGAYLAGSDFGRLLGEHSPVWLSRLGTFPRWTSETLGAGSPAWLAHVQRGNLSVDAAASLPVHPTQLYEAAVGMLLVALWFGVRRLQRFRGQPFLVIVIGYGACRFLVELLRGDAERALLGPPAPAKWWIALVLLGLGLAGVALSYPRLRPSSRSAGGRVTAALAGVPFSRFGRLLPPLGGAVAAGVALWAGPERVVRPSLSQWIALGTLLAAGWAWRRLDRRAAFAQAVPVDQSGTELSQP